MLNLEGFGKVRLAETSLPVGLYHSLIFSLKPEYVFLLGCCNRRYTARDSVTKNDGAHVDLVQRDSLFSILFGNTKSCVNADCCSLKPSCH